MKFIALLFPSVILIGSIFAQTPRYYLFLSNETQPAPNEYEFDVSIFRAGVIPLEMASIQFGLAFDTSILNGGTPSASIVPGSSEFPSNFAPTTVSIGTNVYIDNGTFYQYFNCAAVSASGTGLLISEVSTGCNNPGVRVARFRLRNTVPFTVNSTCKHIWSESAGAGKTNTIVNAYISGVNTNISAGVQVFSHLAYYSGGTCITNIHLNFSNDISSAIDGNGNWTLSPNPAYNNLLIQPDEKNRAKEFSVSIFSASGELIKHMAFSVEKISLELGDIPSGFYFVKIKSDELVTLKKLSVAR